MLSRAGYPVMELPVEAGTKQGSSSLPGTPPPSQAATTRPDSAWCSTRSPTGTGRPCNKSRSHGSCTAHRACSPSPGPRPSIT
jgi:hypothetical protein